MGQRAATRRLPNPCQPSLAVAVFAMPSSTPSLLNRDEMMDRVVRQVSEWMGAPVIEQERINCHPSRRTAVAPLRDAVEPALWAHFTQKEEHFGKDLWLARKTSTASDLRAAMEGIEHRDTDAFIDEIPAAYKPIDQVMADAASIVRVRHTLRRLVSVKGD